MNRDRTRYFGQKISLHNALFLLSKSENPYPVVLVRGKSHVGKTRFVQEICQYFFMHNEFRHVILFQDLSKVRTEEQFSVLISKLSSIIKAKQIGEN